MKALSKAKIQNKIYNTEMLQLSSRDMYSVRNFLSKETAKPLLYIIISMIKRYYSFKALLILL